MNGFQRTMDHIRSIADRVEESFALLTLKAHAVLYISSGHLRTLINKPDHKEGHEPQRCEKLL